jgi:hypothetical protein
MALFRGVVLSVLGVCLCINVECAEEKRVYAIFESSTFVSDMKEACAKAYKKSDKIEIQDSSKLFYGEQKSEDAFVGFVELINDTTEVVAFHGTRMDHLTHDVSIDASFSGDTSQYNGLFNKNELFIDRTLIDYCDFHAGFARIVAQFYENMEKEIDSNLHNVNKLVFTGHSMGAAYAQLAAMLYASNHMGAKNKIEVFAFSSPAVFSEAAVDLYHRLIDPLNSVHIYSNFDPVTTPWRKRVKPCWQKLQSHPSTWQRLLYLRSCWQATCLYQVGVQANVDLIEKGINSHSLDGFEVNVVDRIMQRMRDNYNVGHIDRNLVGRLR